MSKLQRYRLVDDKPQGLVRQFAQTLRSYWSGPLTSRSPELAKLFSAPPTSTGISISEITALNYAAVYSAVNLIASDVASLPLVLYKRERDGGKTKFDSHPLYRLLHDRPNPEMTSVGLRKVLQAHALTWGNGYAEIERDGSDRPVALWPLTPDRVRPYRSSAKSAPLQYVVQNENGGEELFAQRDILHVAGLGWDGTVGYSVIGKARESIGVGVAAERFGGTFFGHGSTFGGVLEYPGPKPTELSDKNYIDSLKRRNQGIENAHQLLSLYNGAKYTQLGVPPNDAQFLETRQFQITEVARWFNVPPHKIGDLTRATFSNIEQQSIDYYTTTLMPWLAVWEQELAFKLVAATEQNIQVIEHIADGLLRGDAAGRAASYSSQFNVGGVTPNEIRASENRNKVKGGDRAFVMRNMIPLDRVDEVIDAEIAKAAAATAPTLPTPTVPTGSRDLEIALEERDLARKIAHEAEDAKDLANARLAEVRVEAMQAADALTAARVAHEAEVARTAAEALRLAEELARAADDVHVAQERVTTLEAERNEMRATRDTVIVERDASVQRCGELDGAVLAHQASVTTLIAEKCALVAERDGLSATLATNDAVAVELRSQVAALTADKQAGIEDMVAVRVELATAQLQREAVTSERDALQHKLAQAELAVTHDRLRDAAVLSAHRGLLADAMGRMVRRELAKAKNYRATPSKLGTWLDTFYDDTERTMFREALLPSVSAHLAWSGSVTDPVAVTERFVAEHFEESQRKLSAIIDAGHDGFAEVLQRTFDQWESERALRFADRVVREDKN